MRVFLGQLPSDSTRTHVPIHKDARPDCREASLDIYVSVCRRLDFTRFIDYELGRL